MKKHYTFIPLKEKDLSSFRKALISSLWFRPCACLLALIVIGIRCICSFSMELLPVSFSTA